MYSWRLIAKLMKMDWYTNTAIFHTLLELKRYGMLESNPRISVSSIKRSFHTTTPLPVGFDLWWKSRTRQGRCGEPIPFPSFSGWYCDQMKRQLYTVMADLSVEGQNTPPLSYIDEGTFYQAGASHDNQLVPLWELGDTNLRDSFIYYPTRTTKSGLKTYLRLEQAENQRMEVLPKW
jgi:hypothetical protein